ncbi:OLC1v1026280C1 [Oldenlandia corymbosa var. corymbosa]|uniref:OLC1v1026280C1 n=1 Tax=Oldenlandia corymbosa var. corymbosa TaxID=529605 RepID=A0AAV1C7C2_OLDCO|nr:OLC1v1026280C1 [Oldenlandia corymbosa var. corymbosa]
MGTRTTGSSDLKVLMLPWLAYGHITPHLQLAKKLVDRESLIFCSTPVNLIFIKNKIPEKCSPSIHLVELHLPDTPELPSSCHTTNGLPPPLMPNLRTALARAKPNLSGILRNLSPDLVIYDVVVSWTASLTSAHGIPAPCYGALGISDAQEDDPEDERPNRSCDRIMLVKTSREIEGKSMDYLYDMMKTKVLPLGPLFSVVHDDQQDEHHELMQWLETKSDLSTVFVSFGSEYFLKKEEMEEIAFGLELSGVNFIWVIRFPVGEKTRPDEALPQGFLERVEKRGRIVEK